jgi:hypothetical protein
MCLCGLGELGGGECVRCVFVVSCYLKKRRRGRRIMVAAPITKAVGFCGCVRYPPPPIFLRILFLPGRIPRDSSSIDELLLLMMMMMLRASPAMFSM